MKQLQTLALAGALLAWTHAAFAQQSIDYASVSGRVLDPSGAVVPDATVTALHVQTDVATAMLTTRTAGFDFPICVSAGTRLPSAIPAFRAPRGS